ncbi:MOSC domain-containing protein [Nocardioides ginsengisoli]|uniref:MOSC domain-containing protein n=1 Tax=Nocardioides ginsengisoli TaxID=363868 RepID=A0ABW3VWC7_9ACTN
MGIATGQIPMQPRGIWTTYDAFFALTKSPALGMIRARLVADARGGVRGNGQAEPSSMGGGPLLAADGSGTLEISRAGELIASAPVVDGLVQLAGTPREWVGELDEVHPLTLEEAGVSLWDVETAQVSIVNLATVRALSAAAGVDLDPDRFRANVYVEGWEPWAELSVVGKRIRIGDAELEIFAPIERCRATSARPGGSEWDINVPALLGAHVGHGSCGVYARVCIPGDVRPGDTIREVCGEHRHLEGPDSDLISSGTPRAATVLKALPSTEETVSIELVDPYGLLEHARPGQYLRIHGGDAVRGWRNYTISATSPSSVRITIRREADGRFSPWVCGLGADDQVLVSGPYGDAVLSEGTTPIAIATAGIGITPALRIMQHLASTGSSRTVSVMHVARSRDAVPHWGELESAAAALSDCTVTLFLTSEDVVPMGSSVRMGRPGREDFKAQLSGDARRDPDIFVCGPQTFVADVVDVARDAGLDESRIHRDPFYSPPDPMLQRRPVTDPGPFTVRWGGDDKSRWTPASGDLLQLAERSGRRVPSTCRSGICGTCATPVQGDTAYLVEPFAEVPAGCVLLCVAVPTSDLTIEDPHKESQS